MNESKYIFKRIGVYLIDIIIVAFITTLLSYVSFINPYKDKAAELNEKHVKLYSDVLSSSNDINKYIEDDVISVEELDELKKYDSLLPVFEKYNEEIKKEDSKNLLNEVFDYYENIYKEDAREIKRLDLYRSIIKVVLSLLYFIALPIYTKGVTVGMKLLKLRVVRTDGTDAKPVDYVIRAVIVYGIVFTIISLIFAYTLSVKDFYTYDNILNKISSIVISVVLFTIVFRRDMRGLHDILSNTKVISTKVEEVETEEVKEEVKVEKKETKKEIPEAKVEKVNKKKKATKKK